MANKRFQRPVDSYSGSADLLYTDKYQKDSQSVPKVAISSSKIDGDFNYIVDAINTLDEDVKSIVYSGIANETILEEHISNNAVTESKLATNSVATNALKDNSITSNKVADLSITAAKLANNSITQDKMALNSVGTAEVIDGAITKDKLAPDAISDSVPVGTIAQFSVDLLPTGWILCNGATLSKDSYPQLVRFLTNSDTELSATIPNLNIDPESLSKYAVKAFSNTIELANLDIAGLTQDLAVLEPKVTANSQRGESTTLWEGAAGGGTLTLAEPITNFKSLELLANQGSSLYTIVKISVDTIINNPSPVFMSILSNWRALTVNTNSINITSGTGLNLVKVIGIK